MVAEAIAPITSKISICPADIVTLSAFCTGPMQAIQIISPKNAANAITQPKLIFLRSILRISGLSPPRISPMNAVLVGSG